MLIGNIVESVVDLVAEGFEGVAIKSLSGHFLLLFRYVLIIAPGAALSTAPLVLFSYSVSSLSNTF